MLKKSIVLVLLSLSLIFTSSCFLLFMDLDESSIESSAQETGFKSSDIEEENSSIDSSIKESESAVSDTKSQDSISSKESLDPTNAPSATQTAEPTLAAGTLSTNLETITVHFIDVGQGDSILIKSKDIAILIDGGDRGTTVLNYLKANNVNSLDLVVGTHPHADHIGGLINVMQNISVKEVLDPGIVHTTKTFEDYLTVIDEKDIKFTVPKPGDKFNFPNKISLEVLHPQNPSSSHLNDASIVIRMVYGGVSFMFAGDAEQTSESQILNRGGNIKSTILKVGHHGSSTSTTQSFLNAVDPEVAIIMCGAGNKYGHPHIETLNRLSAANITLYRTDLHSNIVISTDGKTYSTKTINTVSALPTSTVTPKPTLTNAPIATVTPKPTPTTAPVATVTPKPTPTVAPSATLKVVSYTEEVIAGQIASITIKGKANTEYTIKVTYKSGPSSAAGLEKKTTDSNGNVSWSWKVGPSTTKGSWPIDISGGGESIRVYFEVK